MLRGSLFLSVEYTYYRRARTTTGNFIITPALEKSLKKCSAVNEGHAAWEHFWKNCLIKLGFGGFSEVTVKMWDFFDAIVLAMCDNASGSSNPEQCPCFMIFF